MHQRISPQGQESHSIVARSPGLTEERIAGPFPPSNSSLCPAMKLPRLALAAALLAPLFPNSTLAIDFKTEVQPILREKCFKCHSGPRAKKGIRYDDADTLAKFIGDHDKAVIVPGKPLDSLMIKLAGLARNDTDAMPPPTRGDGLSIPELATLKQWILEGAKLESAAGTDPAPAPTTTEAPKLLSWTNTDGNSLQAYFVKMDGSNVVLKKEDGTEFSYAMSKLSIESRKQASDLSKGE